MGNKRKCTRENKTEISGKVAKQKGRNGNKRQCTLKTENNLKF